jgi:hypothetical protein
VDAPSTEGRDDKRDSRKPYTRPVLQPLGTRQQPRHPLLPTTRYEHYDKLHNFLHVYQHDIDEHHHHGTGDNDIVVHDHDDPEGKHDHLIGVVDHTSDIHDYGPADHNHDPSEVVVDNQLVQHNDPYGHDNSDFLNPSSDGV